MIPFRDWSQVVVHGVTVYAFGVAVAVGVILAHAIVLRRNRALKVAMPSMVDQFVLCVFVSSFFFGHALDTIFYHPDLLRRDPLEIFKVHHGLSSLGGIFGAIVGGVGFIRARKIDGWAFSDMCAYAFPFGWFFGRMGCALSHDHPGRRSSSFLAVNFPPDWPPESPLGGPRFDLGLLEFLLLPLIMALVIALERRHPRKGVLTGAVAIAYPLLRFPLDFLRASDLGADSDPRYASLTPAQWACIALAALGAAILWSRTRPERSPTE